MFTLQVPTVGMVTKVENQAQIDGQPAAVGSPVHTNDTVSTGAKGRLQVTFRDQTNLTLGENASVVIDRYLFDPDASIGEATLNTTKGAFRLATGRLNEMTKKNITVSSPFAAMAVRGTDFWWGPFKGSLVCSWFITAGLRCVIGTAPREPTRIAEGADAPLSLTRLKREPTSTPGQDVPGFHASGPLQR